MLNELESIRRGLANAGTTLEGVHPDVQPVSKTKKPLLVRLTANGELAGIELLSSSLSGHLWTFRKGKHNSFPFVSAPPLLSLPNPEREAFNKSWKDARPTDRREALRGVIDKYQSGSRWQEGWPGKGLLESLQSRRVALANIETEAAAVPAIITRFLTIFSADGENPQQRSAFVNALLVALRAEIRNGIDDWLEAARVTLVGEEKKIGKKKKLVGGDLYFGVALEQFDRDVHDPRNRAAVARALSELSETDGGRCAITGEKAQLHRGNFPQANLPALGVNASIIL